VTEVRRRGTPGTGERFSRHAGKRFDCDHFEEIASPRAWEEPAAKGPSDPKNL